MKTRKTKATSRKASAQQARRRILATSAAALVGVSLFLGAAPSSFGASATWSATPTNGNWEPTAAQTNWSTGLGNFPGSSAGGTSNTDVATFNSASTQTSITINNTTSFPSLNFGGITFDTAAANYTIGSTAGQAVFLTSGGTIQIASTLTATNAVETVNAPLAFSNVAGNAAGAYTFQNNSANGTGAGAGTLNIGGTISSPVSASEGVALTLAGTNTNANTISGVISDGNAGAGSTSVTKNGAGTWVLSAANTYTGATTINAGTLTINGSTAAGSTVGVAGGTLSGTGTINGNATISSGIINFGTNGNIQGTLGATGGNWNGVGTVNGAVNVTANTLTIGAAGNLTTNNTVNVSGSASLAGTGTITGNVNWTSSNSTGTSVGVTIAGTGKSVTVSNSSGGSFAQLDLSAANTYTGGTNVTGALGLTGAGTLGSGTAVVNAGSTIFLNNSTATLTNAFTINGTGTSNFAFSNAGAIWVENGTGTINGAITAASNATITTDPGTTLILGSGGVVKNGVTLTFAGAAGGTGGTVFANGVISGASAGSDLVVDSTTMNENAANTYNGNTFIRSSSAAGTGVLNANVANALPTANGRSAVIMDDSGSGGSTLNIGPTAAGGVGGTATTGTAQAIASLTGATTSKVTLGGNTLTIGNSLGAATGTTFAGTGAGGGISGTGALVKDGTSTQIFTGTNTYTGTTTVNNGILQFTTNTGATSSITVNGSTAGPSGTLAIGQVGGGTVTVNQALTLNGPGFTGNGTAATFGVTGPLGALYIVGGAATTVNFNGLITAQTSNPITPAGGTININGGIFKAPGVNLTFGSTAAGQGGGIVNIGGPGIAGAATPVGISGAANGSLVTAPFTADVIVDSTTLNENIANNYVGNTFIRSTVASGVLNANVANALPNSNNANSNLRTVVVMGDSTSVTAGGLTTTLNIVANGNATQALISPPTTAVAGNPNAANATGAGAAAVVNISNNTTLNVGNAVAGSVLVGTGSTAGLQESFYGTINGSATAALVKDGASTQIIVSPGTSANTFLGTVDVSAGVLQIGDAVTAGAGNWIAAVHNLDVDPGATLNVNLVNGETFQPNVLNNSTGTTPDTAGNAALASTAINGGVTSLVTGGNTQTLGGQITGTGNVVANSGGTTILSNVNGYQGGTVVIGGSTVQIGNAIAGGTAGTGTITLGRNFNTGAADTGNTLNVFNVNGGLLTNNITSGNATGSTGLITSTSAFTNTLSGAITNGTNGVLSITENGANGTLILTNNADNIGAGVATVNAGTLQIGNGTTGNLATTAPVAVNAAGILAIDLGTGGTFAPGITDAGTVNAIATGTNILSGNITGAGVLNQLGTGTTILTGANTYGGTTTITAGTLQIGNGGAAGSLGTGGAVIDNSVLTFNLTSSPTVANAISGTGVLNQNGTGTTTLTAVDTYTGATNVNGGVLQIGAIGGTAGNLTGTSLVTVGNAGMLTLGNVSGGTFSPNVALNGAAAALNTSGAAATTTTVSGQISGTGVLNQNGAGTTILTGANSYSGTTTITAGTLQVGNGGTTGTLGSGNVADGAALVFNRSDTVSVSNVISGAGTVTQAGTGTTILTGADTYTGATNITAGTLQVGNGTAGSIAAASPVAVSAGATLAVDLATTGVFGNAVADGGTVNAIASGTNTLSGAITGAGVFNQNGTGTTILTGADSYTGATTVNAGTLQVGNGATGNLTGTPTVTVNAGGTLAINLLTGNTFTPAVVLAAPNALLNAIETGTNTLSGVISGNGFFNQSGTGTTILTNTETYTGATNVSAGTLQIGNAGTGGNLAGSTVLTVSNGATLTVTNLSGGTTFTPNVILNGATATENLNGAAATTYTYSGNISGTGVLNQTGAGTSILTGTNSYSGTTTITAGTLQVGAGGTTGTLGSGNVVDGTALVFNRTDTVIVGNVISGAGTVTQAGTGTTILTGADTYTGATNVTAGTLQVGNGTTGSIAAASPVAVSAGATLAINLATGSTFGNTVADAGTVNAIESGTNTLSGVISGAGVFNQNGTGTTILTAVETYTGATTVNAGTLQIGSAATAGNLSATTPVTVNNGGTLNLFNLPGNFVPNVLLNGPTASMISTPGLPATTFTLTGVISGSGIFTQAGAGTTVLANTDTYTGPTNVTAGTLQIGAAGGPAGNLTGSTLVTVSNGANLTVTNLSGGAPQTFTPNVTLNGPTAAENLNGAAATTYLYTGNISGAGVLNQNGAGTSVLTGANSYTGTTTIAAGTLQVGNGGTTGTLGSGNVVDNSNGVGGNNGLVFNRTDTVTVGNVISGTGTVQQLGTGTTILTGANSYAGLTTVTNGILQAANNTALGTTAAGTTVANGASLQLANGIAIGAEALTINGAGANPGSGTIGALSTTGGTSSYAGAITAATNSTISADGGTLTLTGGIVKNGVNLTLGGGVGAVARGTINVNTVGISGAAANSDLIVDSTTVNENAADTYNGKTFIRSSLAVGSGILNANVANALPTANGRSTVRMDDIGLGGSTLNIGPTASGGVGGAATVGANQSIASLTGTATSLVTLGANTLTIGFGTGIDTNGDAGATFAGVISGTGGITKDETSTEIFSGPNTYTGATMVTGGTLKAGIATNAGNTAGAFGVNSAVTVQTNAAKGAGATLDLAGFSNTIGSLSDGGGLNAGAGTGTVTSSAGAATLTINTITAAGGAATTSYGGAITGPLSLVINGAGTQSISNQANTYTGTTTVNAGATLDIDSSNGPGGFGSATTPLGTGGLIINAGANIGTGMNAAGFAASTIANAVTVNGSFNVTNVVLPLGTLGAPNTGVGAGGPLINTAYVPFGATGAVSNGVQFTGTTTLTSAGVTTINTASGYLDLRGTVTGGGGLTFIGNTYTYMGNAAFPAAAVVDAPNTYGGLTTVGDGVNPSYLTLGKNAVNAYAIPGSITINPNAYVQYDSGNGAVSNQINPIANAIVNGTLDTAGLNQQLATLNGNGIVRLDSAAYNASYGGAVQSGTLTVGSGVFSGGITGVGGVLTKVSPGLFVLSGVNTYTGNTNVNAGVLQVDGSTTSANTIVAFGAQLQGTGVIGGNVVNNGTVKPGDSPGTLTVKGSYTQSATGNLRIELASTTNYGRLQVGGVANLSGTLTAVSVNGFTPQPGNVFTVLTAGAGVNGRFGTFVNQTGAPTGGNGLLGLQVIYDPNDVKLEFLQNSIISTLSLMGFHGLTPNQIAVAENLDSNLTNKRLAGVFNYLDKLPLGSIPGALDQIAPEEVASIYNTAFALANVQSAALQRRTADIRAGSAGFSAEGFHMAGGGPNYEGTLGSDGVSGPDGKEVKETKEVAPPYEPRLGVFVTGVGEWLNVGDHDFNARGYDLDTGGFTLGIDYKLTSNFAIGLNAGYAHTHGDLTDGGHLNVDGGNFGLYSTFFTGGFYADVAASGGYNSYEVKRAGLGGSTFGDTDGGQLNVLVGTGYMFHVGGLTVGPTASFQYDYLSMEGFTERGSLAPLNFPSQNQDSIRSAVGGKLTYDWKLGSVVIRPEVAVSWQHEFGDTAYAIDSGFANADAGLFTVHGPTVGRDSLLLGTGFAVLWNERFSTYVYYDGEFARSNYDANNNVSGGFRLSF